MHCGSDNLKRVFGIDIETCAVCGGTLRIIACIEDPAVIVRKQGQFSQLHCGSDNLKRVFGIDIETCAVCGGTLRIIACIEDPAVIEKILAHIAGKEPSARFEALPPCRAPPQTSVF